MRRLLPFVVLGLVLGEGLLVLLSWLLSAAMMPGVRSMLSSEGIRWFFAHLVDGLLTPLLAWLLMVAMSVGCLVRSGLFKGSQARRAVSADDGQRKLGLRVTVLLAVVYVGIVLLTALPHGVLLSGTGTLGTSPFSRALVPIVCFAMLLCGIVYGLTAHKFSSLSDILQSMTDGLIAAAPLLLLYVLACQFFQTACYVFMVTPC